MFDGVFRDLRSPDRMDGRGGFKERAFVGSWCAADIVVLGVVQLIGQCF